MKQKHQEQALRNVFKVLQKWKDPHDVTPITTQRIIDHMDVTTDGKVQLIVTPSRPHCPCCLYNLSDLKQKLLAVKHIQEVHIDVARIVDVPADNFFRGELADGAHFDIEGLRDRRAIGRLEVADVGKLRHAKAETDPFFEDK